MLISMCTYIFHFILQYQSRFCISYSFLGKRETVLHKQDLFFLAFHFPESPFLPDNSHTLSDEPTETSINHENASRNNFTDEIARVSRHRLRNRPQHIAFAQKVRPRKLNCVLRVPFALFFLQLPCPDSPPKLDVKNRHQGRLP